VKKPVVLILGAGTHQLDAVRAARELGATVWTVDYSAESPAHREADHFWVRSTIEAEALREDWEKAGRPVPDGVLAPCTDSGLFTLSYLSEQWHLPGPRAELVELVCDKRNFRSWQKAQGLNHPGFVLACECGPCSADSDWVVKPARASGTRGLCFVRNGAGWEEAWQRAWQRAREVCLRGEALAEEWIEGRQLTAEGFWQDGRLAWWGLTDRLIPGPQNPLTCGHIFPSKLAPSGWAQVGAELERTLRALPFTEGFFDADLVWREDRAVVLELAPRLGGNRLARLWRQLGGPDVAREAVRYAMGETVHPGTWPVPRPGFVELLGLPDGGTLFYEAEKLKMASDQVPGLLDVGMDLPPGGRAAPWRDGRSTVGYLIGATGNEGPTREEIIWRTKQFLGWREE
jgi:biotin carboxylase